MANHDVSVSNGINHTLSMCLRNPHILQEFNTLNKTNINPKSFVESFYNSELSKETRRREMQEFNKFIESVRHFVWENLKPLNNNKLF